MWKEGVGIKQELVQSRNRHNARGRSEKLKAELQVIRQASAEEETVQQRQIISRERAKEGTEQAI